MWLQRLAVLAIAAVFAACHGGGGSGPDDFGYQLGVVAGSGQTAVAGDTRLAEDVRARLVRQELANGSTILDLIVTPAYAQTQVEGSPVPGAVVCSEPPVGVPEDGTWLRPLARCTNTDENGDAYFTYIPPTTAGEAWTYVRGTVEGQVVDLDSVSAVVLPGELAGFSVVRMDTAQIAIGDTLDIRPALSTARDQYFNAIDVADVRALPDSVIGWAWGPIPEPAPSEPTGTGWHVVIPPEGDAWECRQSPIVGGGYLQTCETRLLLWIDGVSGSGGVFHFSRPVE